MTYSTRWKAARWAACLMVVLAGAGCRSAPAHVKKAAKAGMPAPLRFVVYGDTRNGHAMHRQIVALIMKQKPAFVLQTGDLVADGSNDALWKIYDDITTPIRSRIPLYPARGNHDVGGEGYAAHVPTTGVSGTTFWYSFNRAGCHVVSLDTESPFAAGTPQYAWLERDLQGAAHARHTFVFFHEAAYSVGAHGSNENVQKAWCPLFRKYGVRMVFMGHDHIYYRTLRDGGIPYIVTGGGGAPLYDLKNKQDGIPGDVAEKTNNIVVCDVVGNKVYVHALRADGSLLDHLTATKR